jgi:putative transposase
LFVLKSIKQSYIPSSEVFSLMQEYRRMTNDCIRVGLANDNLSNLKKLSKLTYKELKIRFRKVPSYYKLCAISKAAGILNSRRKSINRGYPTKDPYVKRPLLISCYGINIVNGKLRLPLSKRKYEFIPLNAHTLEVLQNDKSLTVRSFTLTERSLSLCIMKEVPEIVDIKSAIGIDRNLRNLTVGNESFVIYYDMNKVVEIGETTKNIVRSFKRNDVRIRKEIASKYGRRRKARIGNILNRISKDVVERALENKSAIIFEDIRYIRSMYRKGNYQGRHYRRQMNSNWPYGEIKRQVEYKAQWEGVPIIHLSKSETRGTSSKCYICGELLQSSRGKPRQLWCRKCERWFDRDLVGVMNISHRGWVRFAQSHNVKGIGRETMKRNPTRTTVIQRVDPMKLCQR